MVREHSGHESSTSHHHHHHHHKQHGDSRRHASGGDAGDSSSRTINDADYETEERKMPDNYDLTCFDCGEKQGKSNKPDKHWVCFGCTLTSSSRQSHAGATQAGHSQAVLALPNQTNASWPEGQEQQGMWIQDPWPAEQGSDVAAAHGLVGLSTHAYAAEATLFGGGSDQDFDGFQQSGLDLTHASSSEQRPMSDEERQYRQSNPNAEGVTLTSINLSDTAIIPGFGTGLPMSPGPVYDAGPDDMERTPDPSAEW